MKKNIILSLIIWALLLIKVNAQTYKNYSFSDQKIHLELPVNWEVKEGHIGTIFFASRPKAHLNDFFQENVNLTSEHESISSLELNQYAEQTRKSLALYLTEYEIKETGETEIDGQKAAWTIFMHKQQIFTFKVITYHIKRGDKGYTLTCTALENEFANYYSVFKKIVKSLAFAKA